MNRKTIRLGGLLILIMIMFPKEMPAYIDPGTGSYLFQILIAGIVAVGFTVRVFWRKIIGFLKRLFSRKADS